MTLLLTACQADPNYPDSYESTDDSAETPTALGVDCHPVASWASGEVTVMSADDHGVVVAAKRTLSSGDPPETWLARLGQDGVVEWELILPEPGRPSAVAGAGDELRVIQHQATGAKVLTIDGQGSLIATTEVPNAGDNPAQASTLLPHGEHWLLGGTVASDMWLATMTADGSFETLFSEDHLGFADGIHHLLPLESGYLAIASVGTTPATIDGDISVFEAVDTMLIFFDEELKEQGRTILSDEDEYVSTITTAATQTNEGFVVLVGYREPTLETGEGRAWASGLIAQELSWFREWRGPSDSGLPHRLASLHAAEALGAAVVVGGRQHTSEGLRRWHMLLDGSTGQVLVDELGGPRPEPFDSYLAGAAAVSGSAWFSGSTASSKASEQWICSFVITD
ncbi:MAG: hypothetical protein R6X02_15590 [Enhygromyxa sp.]